MQPSTTATQYRSPKVVLFIVAGLVLLGLWYGFAKSAAPPAATTATATAEAPSRVLGQQRHLLNANGSATALVPSKATLDSAVRSLALNDRVGFEQAMSTSVSIPNGTAVLVIDTDYVENQPARQVRVLTGPYSGQAGWVLANALAP